MTNDTVYKAVAIIKPGKYKSICYSFGLNAHMLEYAVDYQIGKITKPSDKLENSKLMAFEALRLARRFAKHNIHKYEVAVLRCVAGDDIVPLKYVSLFNTSYITRFWSLLNESFCGRMTAPRGTVCCDWIKPISYVGTYKFDRKTGAKLWLAD